MTRILFSLTLGLLLTGAAAADWPQWRGPTGQGHTDDAGLPLTWGGKGGDNVLWKAALFEDFDGVRRDQNQSSPVVVKGRVIVTASFWPAGVEQKEQFPVHQVSCFDAKTGKVLWRTKVEPGPWKLTDLRGGYTASTPASDGERIFVVFGSAVLAALDLDGKPVWRKELVPYNFDVCIGASPIVHAGKVYFQSDQIKGTSHFLAFDAKTGKVLIEQKRPEAGFSHSTPVLGEVDGKPQFLVAASDAVQGVDPETGKVLWWCKAKGDTASVVYDGKGLVYCDSGRGGPGVAVAPGGTGDVTKTREKWRLPVVPEGFSSPVIVGEYLYRTHQPGVVHCWKLATGESVYSERLQGVETAASPVAAPGGRIYFASAGKSYVLKAGPKAEVLAVNDLGDGSRASPAVGGGRLYLRGTRYLWCVGEKGRE